MPRSRSLPLPAARQLAQFLPFSLTILTLGATMLLASCGTDAGASNAPVADTTVPVRVVALTNDAVPRASSISVTGTLAGKEEVALAFKIGGVVAKIAVDPGQAVRAGQVLAELRPTEIAAQVATALEARKKAERDLLRVTRLYADSVATLEQLQDARTALQVATNSTQIAQFNADYAVIRAPGDGVVLSRQVEPGQVVEPGRQVLVVRRNGRGMVVRVGLPDRDAVRVRIGDTATVTFDAMPDRSFMARVTQRAAAATAGSGDYAIEFTLAESASTLPSGLVAHVTIHPHAETAPSRTARVMVPLDALVDADADSAAVFVLRDNGSSVSRRTVKLADVAEALRTAQVQVLTGLDGSEQVVIAGMTRLVDGSAVRVITTPAARLAADAAPQWRVGQ